MTGNPPGPNRAFGVAEGRRSQRRPIRLTSLPVSLTLAAAALALTALISLIIRGQSSPGHVRPPIAGAVRAATAPRLITSLMAAGPIGQIAFSRDGRSLAAVSGDGTIRVWDTATGKITAKLRTPGNLWLAWSPDGNELAAGGTKVRLWDPATGKAQTLTATGLDGPVAFSPDGRTLAAAVSYVGPAQKPVVVQLWNVATRTLARTLTSKDDKFAALAFSPGGQLLAAGGQVSLLRGPARDDGASTDIWNVATGHHVARFRSPQHPDPHGFGINSYDSTVAFSPDGALLATGRELPAMTPAYTGIRLWSITTRRMITQLTAAGGGSVTFSPDGRTLAAVSAQGTSVQLWNIAARTAQTIALPSSAAGTPPFDANSTLAYGPDGKTLAVPVTNTIQLWAVGSQ